MRFPTLPQSVAFAALLLVGTAMLDGGVGALMNPMEMTQRGHSAFNRYFNQGTGSTISSAWQNLARTIACVNAANQNPVMYRYTFCLELIDAVSQTIDILAGLVISGRPGSEEYHLLVEQYNQLINILGGTERRMQDRYEREVDVIERIAETDVEAAERRLLNFVEHGGADFAGGAEVRRVAQEIRHNLGAIEAHKRQFQHVKQERERLLARLKQNPNDESLWQQYITLLRGRDAIESLKPENQKALLAEAEQKLKTARENNHLNQLFEQFEKRQAVISGRFESEPIQARKDYLELLQGETSQSLDEEYRLEEIRRTRQGINTLREQQQRKEQEDFLKKQIDKYTARLDAGEDREYVLMEFQEILNDDSRMDFMQAEDRSQLQTQVDQLLAVARFEKEEAQLEALYDEAATDEESLKVAEQYQQFLLEAKLAGVVDTEMLQEKLGVAESRVTEQREIQTLKREVEEFFQRVDQGEDLVQVWSSYGKWLKQLESLDWINSAWLDEQQEFAADELHRAAFNQAVNILNQELKKGGGDQVTAWETYRDYLEDDNYMRFMTAEEREMRLMQANEAIIEQYMQIDQFVDELNELYRKQAWTDDEMPLLTKILSMLESSEFVQYFDQDAVQEAITQLKREMAIRMDRKQPIKLIVDDGRESSVHPETLTDNFRRKVYISEYGVDDQEHDTDHETPTDEGSGTPTDDLNEKFCTLECGVHNQEDDTDPEIPTDREMCNSEDCMDDDYEDIPDEDVEEETSSEDDHHEQGSGPVYMDPRLDAGVTEKEEMKKDETVEGPRRAAANGDKITFEIHKNPADPVIVDGMTSDGDVISLIGVKAADGTLLSVNQFQIVDSEGTVTYITLEGGVPTTAVDSSGASVNFEWSGDASIVHITTVSSDGLVRTTMDINLAETSTEKKSFKRRAPLSKPFHQGERDVHQYQSQCTKEKTPRQTSPVTGAAVEVTVSSDGSEKDLVVGAYAYRDYKESTMEYSRIEHYVGVETSSSGVFHIQIPTVPTSTIGKEFGDACNSIHGKVSELCTWYARVKAALKISARSEEVGEILSKIPGGKSLGKKAGKALNAITDPENVICPRLLIPNAVVICSAVFKVFKWYCNNIATPRIPVHEVVDDLGLNPQPELGKVVCDFVTQYMDSTIDSFGDEKVLLKPYVVFPGSHMTAKGQVIKLTPGFTGLLPNRFSIVNDQNTNPQIISLTVFPTHPAPYEHYVVTVGYVRATDDTVTSVYVHGTDSYIDDVSCYGVHAICVLHVPGAEGMVEDIVTVTISNPTTGYATTHTLYIQF